MPNWKIRKQLQHRRITEREDSKSQNRKMKKEKRKKKGEEKETGTAMHRRKEGGHAGLP